jgi:hypothetical protein
MEGTIIISTAELRKIIREELEATMLVVKESAQIDEQKKKRRYYLEEASQYLRMAVPTLRMHRSKIGGTKIGKRWVFTEEELDRFIEKHKSRVIY